MKTKEIMELEDKILNPITIIKLSTEDEEILKQCDRIVDYIKSLTWCKSYDEEVKELRYLIRGYPGDVKLLKQEYYELTGKHYKSYEED